MNDHQEIDTISDHQVETDHSGTPHSDRMKQLGESTAYVAHEIRNVLGGITGFASLLKHDLAHSPHQQRMVEQIIEGTDNLNHLVSQILLFARPLHPHFEKTNLNKLLNDLQQLLLADSNITQQHIHINVELPPEQIHLLLDYILFKSALLNIILNATQAMKNQGIITIKIQKDPSHIFISITDTGIGIPNENIAKLFTPFFTTKPNGNGIGLCETQKIIHAHGGTIEVTSLPGNGSTFLIKLPVRIS